MSTMTRDDSAPRVIVPERAGRVQAPDWRALAERLAGELGRLRDVVAENDAASIDEALDEYERATEGT